MNSGMRPSESPVCSPRDSRSQCEITERKLQGQISEQQGQMKDGGLLSN